jgi:uncharacterized membrane protein
MIGDRVDLYIAVLLLIVVSISVASAESVNSLSNIYYYVIYDPVDNSGLLVVNITIVASEPYQLDLPINVFTEDASLEYLGYNYTGDLKVIGLGYSNESRVISGYVYGAGTLTLTFNVSNVLDELLGAYSLYIDTTPLEVFTKNISVDFIVVGPCNVTFVEPRRGFNNYVKGENTVLEFNGAGYWFVVFQLEISEVTQTTSAPTGKPSEGYTVLLYLSLALAVVIASLILVFAYYRRRRAGLVVERIDYTRDDATRLIIKALKDAGEKGLLQSEIARITGLPKSSISRRVRRLEEEGFVEVKRVGKYSYVYLTSKGLELAKKISGK